MTRPPTPASSSSVTATVLLQTLVAGPRHATEIPVSRSARVRAARTMEANGLLVRDRGTGNYSLTPAGIKHAISQGIMPVAENYFGDIPARVNLPTGPIDMEAIRHKQPADLEFIEWLAWVILVGTFLAAAELLAMKLTHYF